MIWLTEVQSNGGGYGLLNAEVGLGLGLAELLGGELWWCD